MNALEPKYWFLCHSVMNITGFTGETADQEQENIFKENIR